MGKANENPLTVELRKMLKGIERDLDRAPSAEIREKLRAVREKVAALDNLDLVRRVQRNIATKLNRLINDAARTDAEARALDSVRLAVLALDPVQLLADELE